MNPHSAVSPAQVFGLQLPTPQTFGVPPPPQVPLEHVPQLTVPPQPSLMGPQLAPTLAQVRGEQAGVPHTLAVPPPPQVSGAPHWPQSSRPPQPSAR
jgi:hypothetical protein